MAESISDEMRLEDVTRASTLAREQFMTLVASIRPELHRYCTRMTGSVFDGEDVLQDSLARAWFALAQMESPPPLRPWLFRIAHNAATDFLRRYETRHVDSAEDLDGLSDSLQPDENAEAAGENRTEVALSILMSLPPVQRSAFALKDILDLSLDEIAHAMGTTVGAVKSALVRARRNVAEARNRVGAAHAGSHTPTTRIDAVELARLHRYADLFNARDWDALRTCFNNETHLDLVSYHQLTGAPAAQYFTRYQDSAPREDIRLVPGIADGVPVLAVFRPSTSSLPAYYVRLDWDREHIALVRDYRQVSYIARDSVFSRMD